MKNEAVRPFSLIILAVVVLTILASLLVTRVRANSFPLDSSSCGTAYPSWPGGCWIEMGKGSASGGGISSNETESDSPSVAIGSDGKPIIAWNNDAGQNEAIYVLRWNGESWIEMGDGSASGGGISQTGTSTSDHSPAVAVAPNGTVVAAWENWSSAAQQSEIYVRQWNGASWVEMGTGSASGGGISKNSGDSKYPDIAIGPDGAAVVAWEDDTTGNPEIYVRRWDGQEWQEIGSGSASGTGISNHSFSSRPSIAIPSANRPIVSWYGYGNNGTAQIYVRGWNGTAWSEIGGGSATGGGISASENWDLDPSLAIMPDDKPIIAWQSNGIYVRHWDGQNWSEIGEGSASGDGIGARIPGGTARPAIAVGSNGLPVVAFEAVNNRHIYVLRFDGNSWIEMGGGSASGLGIDGDYEESLAPAAAVGSDNNPIVTWHSRLDSNTEIYVRRWGRCVFLPGLFSSSS